MRGRWVEFSIKANGKRTDTIQAVALVRCWLLHHYYMVLVVLKDQTIEIVLEMHRLNSHCLVTHLVCTACYACWHCLLHCGLFALAVFASGHLNPHLFHHKTMIGHLHKCQSEKWSFHFSTRRTGWENRKLTWLCLTVTIPVHYNCTFWRPHECFYSVTNRQWFCLIRCNNHEWNGALQQRKDTPCVIK